MSLRNASGFTLIEAVIGMAIMAVMMMAIAQLFVLNLSSVSLGKARASGTALANSQIEYLRSLPYLSLATQNGAIYPAGSIPDSQTLSQDGMSFTVTTKIIYVDDTYDNKAPTDTNPADYKKATVSIYLQPKNKLVAQLTSDFSNKTESSTPNTGVLTVNVLNASGQPVPNANILITNSTVTPAVNINTTADNGGILSVPNLPIDSGNDYFVTASLAGYSTSATARNNGTQLAVQLNPNVLNQQVTSITLSIDQLSIMPVIVKNQTGAVLPNLAITVTGSKKNFTNPNVFKYSQATTTDSAGTFTLNNMEWDSYSFTPPSGYYVLATSPYQPYALSPNVNQTVTLTLSTISTWPRIASVSPVTGSVAAGTVAVTINGTNLPTGTSVDLILSGSDGNGSNKISATSVVSTGGIKLTMNFSLTGHTPGVWDIAVKQGGNTVTQSGGFVVIP